MKAVLERIEHSWWNFHIRMMDESEFVRDLIPRIKELWEYREEAVPYLAWSIMGFPLGIVLGLLTLIPN
jgi:hypothetical protein